MSIAISKNLYIFPSPINPEICYDFNRIFCIILRKSSLEGPTDVQVQDHIDYFKYVTLLVLLPKRNVANVPNDEHFVMVAESDESSAKAKQRPAVPNAIPNFNR